MNLFGNKLKISRPQPTQVIPPVGDVQFPGTSIHVRNSIIFQTGNPYAPVVLQHLSDIQSFPVGRTFLAAITSLGKKQVIKYGGPGANQAAGGGLASYKLLRRHHDTGEAVNFAAELRTTLGASAHDKRWLAEQAYHMNLPQWSGDKVPSPLSTLKAPPQPPANPRPLPPTPVDLIERKVDEWLAGTSLPDRDQMDILCLVLEPWLRDGTGTNTLISYDPHKVVVAGVSRPPQVALYHELVHAFYNASGGQLGREDSIDEGNGGRLFELMAVGLPPFEDRPYSENRFRSAVGVETRKKYP